MTVVDPGIALTSKRTWSDRARAYFSLTRPRLLPLVLLTGPAAMMLGSAWPGAGTATAIVVATGLLTGAAGTLNAWYERDRDALMERTRDRALPAQRISPRSALCFGLLLATLGLVLVGAAGGWLAFAIGLAALLHYLLVYTVWLKPRTPLAVVVGGISGAISPLVAGAAASGQIDLWSLGLFAIVFVWQPPHFWAIALYRRDEYAKAGFPVLPSAIGARATRWHQLAWALALIPVTLIPWLIGPLGFGYLVTAVAGGTFFCLRIIQAMRCNSKTADRAVFAASLLYLTGLFAVLTLELVWA
ncbi:MAG: protoheme IX farnesyltransferase [bacterium]|nr:protoheme IX farnesyltransferase [bacterium]